MKRGLFGGSFNPLHMGHINSAQTIYKKLELDFVHIIPAAQNPMKTEIEGPNPSQRLEMVKRAFEDYGDEMQVEDYETLKGGLSYSIDTINEFKTRYPKDDLYLIMGLDQFEHLQNWEKFEEILSEVDLVVTSRPGYFFPTELEDVNEKLRSHIETFDTYQASLKSGHLIHFMRLKDLEMSGEAIRKKIRLGQSVAAELPLKVENYIKENDFYRSIGPKIGDYLEFSKESAQFLEEKGGVKVLLFDLSAMDHSPCDYTIIVSGSNKRFVQALNEYLIESVRKEYGVGPLGMEGKDEGDWIVLDYGALMVHLFYEAKRYEYRLEELWGARKIIDHKE